MASILAMLDRLKATKASREGETSGRCETTPAEWASALLADAKEREGPAHECAKKK